MKDPYYVDANVQFSNSIILMREISRIAFLENFEKNLAPGIAKELQRQGVKFPKG